MGNTRRFRATEAVLPIVACLLACSPVRPPSAPLSNDIYVWQRVWSSEVTDALTDLPHEVGTIHVLVGEFAGTPRKSVDVSPDVGALARSGRAIVAVIRVEGTEPLDGISLLKATELARSWVVQGVRVRGVEVDYDCATSVLPAYADWLNRERHSLNGLTLSITALPTWASSPALARVVAAADDVVVQLHTIRAPQLFDVEQARAFAENWGRATHRPFRVALPTYRARLVTGQQLATNPEAVSTFLSGLRERPIAGLTGVVWFRLGNRADPNAWSTSTLMAVLRGDSLGSRMTTSLQATDSGAFDIVIRNSGPIDADAPVRLTFTGAIELIDGVGDYRPDGSVLLASAPRHLRAGESFVAGFVRGKDVSVAAP